MGRSSAIMQTTLIFFPRFGKHKDFLLIAVPLCAAATIEGLNVEALGLVLLAPFLPKISAKVCGIDLPFSLIFLAMLSMAFPPIVLDALSSFLSVGFISFKRRAFFFL